MVLSQTRMPQEHVDSYWVSTAHSLPRRGVLEGDRSLDVAVIGGGFTGLAAAYFLRDQNLEVGVLEQNRVGWGASGRNGGFLIPQAYKKSFEDMVEDEGIEHARRMLEVGLESVRMVKQMVDRHDIDCSYSDCGSLLAAYKPRHFDKFKKHRDFMGETFDYELQLLGENRMGEELNSPLYHGVMIDPHSASFHPLNYALGLAEAVEEKGVDIYEKTRVTEVEIEDDEAIVRTNRGRVTADRVVVGTNGYTPPATPRLQRSIFHIFSYIIATEPLSSSQARALIPRDRVVSDSKKFLYYYRLSPGPEQRFLFGSPVSFLMDEGPQLYEKARQQMVSVFPQLESRSIEYRWGGKTGFPIDQHPHIGHTDDRVIHYGLGYCGTGAALSTLMGKMLARQIQGNPVKPNPLEKRRLRTIPLHSFRGLLVHLANLYYRATDLVY